METNFTPFPVLATKRLILRPLKKTDAPHIFSHRSDAAVNTYLDDFRHNSIEDTHAFIDRVQKEVTDGKTILWVLTLKGDDRFMGTVCLWNISVADRKAETGYTLEPQFHKMGYMDEALAKALDFGFHTIKLKTIVAYTHENNEGSIRLLLKNGFRQGMPEKQVPDNRVFFSLAEE